MTTRADARDFGSDIGRGMQGAAQGVASLGDAMAQVKALQDETVAREHRNAYMEARRKLMYDPETGYMMSEGKNALDGRKGFEDNLKALRKQYAEKLTPAQQQMFMRSTDPLEMDGLQSAIVHNGNQLKRFVDDEAKASADNFQNEALTSYKNPALADKYTAAGLMEIKNRAEKLGWSPEVLDQEQRNYLSTTTKKMALRIASDGTNGPLNAKAYIEKQGDRLSAEDRFELDTKLKPIIEEAEDIRTVGDVMKVRRDGAQAGPPIAGRSLGQAGPTKVRAFLIERTPGKGPSAVDGLDEGFASNLAAMIEDAPPEIRQGLQIMSGYRSVDRQTELYSAAVRKYGSEAAARKWVAKPGGSQHNHGRAADLMYNGVSLGKAPEHVRKWVHANAGNYGLYFPMGHEPWHIEPVGSRVQSKVDGPVSRTVGPSFDEIEERLSAIADPERQGRVRAMIYKQLEGQDKARSFAQKAAKDELWRMWEAGGQTPDQAPVEVRIAAGSEAINSIYEFAEKEAGGRAVTNEQVLYQLQRMEKEDPQSYAQLDLTDYYSQLSRTDRQERVKAQNSILGDYNKAVQEGSIYADAYKQADTALDAVGLTTTGLDADKNRKKREEMSLRLARFQNAMKDSIDDFRGQNDGRVPTYAETQAIINRLLLPVVIKSPGEWFGTNTADAFNFETSMRPDGSTVEINVQYDQIPVDIRNDMIEVMTDELGRKPTNDEIVERYEAYVMGVE
jgi:hypothetical protein